MINHGLKAVSFLLKKNTLPAAKYLAVTHLNNLLKNTFTTGEQKSIVEEFGRLPDKTATALALLIDKEAGINQVFRTELEKIIDFLERPEINVPAKIDPLAADDHREKKMAIKKTARPLFPGRGFTGAIPPKKSRALPSFPSRGTPVTGGPAAKKSARRAAPKKASPKPPPKKAAKKKRGAVGPTKPILPSVLAPCYTRVSMDRQVKRNKAVPVNVTISLEQLELELEKASGIQVSVIDITKKLAVSIRPVNNIEVIGAKKKTTNAPQPNSPRNISFKVNATELGICQLAVDVWQDQAPVCTVQLAATCVKTITDTREKAKGSPSSEIAPYPEKLIQLRITDRKKKGQWQYEFELSAPMFGINGKTFTSPLTWTDRAQFITSFYQGIENLPRRVKGGNHFRKNLITYGATLTDDLFPPALKKFFYDYQGRIRNMQIVTTEPFIPWELLVIKNPAKGVGLTYREKFIGELGVTRWLMGTGATEELIIRKSKARYLVPTYINDANKLPGGKKEIAFLTRRFKAKKVITKPGNVDKLLDKPGSFDLLHFCCHGAVSPRNIMDAGLLLNEDNKTGTVFLSQSTIDQCGTISNGKIKPVVVLNACQSARSGMKLSSVGGFATSFLKAGAGVFVGSLWAIRDRTAVTFIETLYGSLLAHKTLAESVVEARKKSRGPMDSTFISYVVYGHPFAKLKVI